MTTLKQSYDNSYLHPSLRLGVGDRLFGRLALIRRIIPGYQMVTRCSGLAEIKPCPMSSVLDLSMYGWNGEWLKGK